MAVGTTADFTVKRNKIVEQALRAVRAIKSGIQPDHNLMRDGILALNEILREEDQEQTGQKRSLWALSDAHIFLAVGQYRYTTTEGLGSNVQDIVSLLFRDTGGGDMPMEYISTRQYEELSPKNEVGDPTKLYLEPNHLSLSSQAALVWPVPDSIGTTSEVTGTDALNYKCILKHTSIALTRPITGAGYQNFWTQAGSAGATWVTATDYTNGTLIRMKYKRPLFDFDLADNDPDLPLGWGNYLKWRVAIEIGPSFKLKPEELMWMERQADKAAAKLFPNTRVKTQDYHHKAVFF